MCEEWRLSEAGQVSCLFADASAALSIAKRQGAGKMGHINVKSLWLQEKALQRILAYDKVKGEDNPSDGLTKHVKRELIDKYLEIENLEIRQDRADASLKLAGNWVHCVSVKRFPGSLRTPVVSSLQAFVRLVTLITCSFTFVSVNVYSAMRRL